jgi:hypothetical protein
MFLAGHDSWNWTVVAIPVITIKDKEDEFDARVGVMMMFIGTRFSNLYTAVDTPA